MKLQLLRPTLVFAGAWNPAVFQPGWLAKNVHGIPVGAEVRVDEVTVVEEGHAQKKINYMQALGILVSQTRLEIYPTAIDDQYLKTTEEKVAKILELLPHTPLSAFGVNFFFEDRSPSSALRCKVRSGDGLSDILSIVAEQLTSYAEIEEHVQLNLQRRSQQSAVSFNFNYHQEAGEIEVIRSEIVGVIQRRLDQSIDILKRCYGLSEYDVVRPELPPEMDSPDHA